MWIHSCWPQKTNTKTTGGHLWAVRASWVTKTELLSSCSVKWLTFSTHLVCLFLNYHLWLLFYPKQKKLGCQQQSKSGHCQGLSKVFRLCMLMLLYLYSFNHGIHLFIYWRTRNTDRWHVSICTMFVPVGSQMWSLRCVQVQQFWGSMIQCSHRCLSLLV